METKYPSLRRPKRKLCYLTTKESPPQQWAGLSLGDVDKMFDDLDPTLNDDEDVDGDLLPQSPLLQMSDTEINQSEREASLEQQEEHLTEKPVCQVGAEGDVLHPAAKSPSPTLDIEKPVKTSSPIEENMAVQGVKELGNEKGRAVSPILFVCEDEEKEETKTPPRATQKSKCSPSRSKEFEMESPPRRVALSKPTMSNHKNKVERSCNKSHPVKEKSSKKSEIPVLQGKRKAPRHENTDPPMSAVRQEAEVAAPKKKSESVHRQPSLEVSSRVDMTNFLQKLRDAAQPKPACTRKPPSPVKVPTPPEPEDDFLILEDESPLWFSIPSKTAASGRQKTSSADKDGSPDMRLKHSSVDTAPKQQESKLGNVKPGGQTVQKTKKMKGKEKKNEATEPENDVDELCSPEELPAGELMEQEKPNKKKQRLKKVPSKDSDKAEEQPKDTASRETDEGRATLKIEKKSQKSPDMKRSKSLKDGNENTKTNKVKSLKGARKETQGSGAVKESQKSSEEHADAEDLGSLSGKQVMNSEDCQILEKRKRRQTGEWWLCFPEKTEETKVTDKQPTPKKSKQNSKKPSEEVPSPVKTKKDRVLKRRSQTKCAPSSSQKTNKARERKNKQNKSRGGTPAKTKASEEIFDAIVAEQIDEQEQLEVLDQDVDPVDSSPLVLVHRDHSLDSGSQVFQRVYCRASNEKLSITPTPASPRGSQEQLRPAQSEKRKRKPPSNWWMVDGSSDVENINSQPQQKEPKPRKERKKQSKQSRSPGLGTPKNGNVVDSFRPLGEAPVPSLKVKPLSTPKTVKRSLATFKDIFTSATETPTVVGSREAGQNNRLKVTACPAVEVTVTDYTALGNTEEAILSMNAAESNDLPNQEGQQDSNFQSENTLKVLRSGPSSMIELEQYQENEDLILPSSRVHAVMSASDLCAPPLKPLILQPKDKANLTEWFKSLWSPTVNNGAEITPDQFDWYFYQGRAIGMQVDLNHGSICNGKILLGSYMKKPLWVDHSATTVFNVLTSSVSVIIDTRESRFYPGQSFMAPHGHAYSIQNVSALPAVLYFTRVLAESSD